jgi:hypothetical protein
MNYLNIKKGSVLGFLSLSIAFTASAQSLEEKDLKLNVSKITNSTAQLEKLEPITFNYNQKNKALKFPSGQQFGFSTENLDQSSLLLEKSTRMYESGKNNMKVARYDEVDVNKLIPIMVGALKEQQAQIEELKAQIGLLRQQAK